MRHQGQVKSLKNHRFYEAILPQHFLPYCIYITKQKKEPSAEGSFLACRKRHSLFRHRGLQPAAAHKLCTCGTQFPRLQAEKCFLARTGRARKLT
jgi:hypothetical protein